ncbi:MAG TPA: serine hydrolase, partial [Dehalococcoidia bacterium]|nr:serine hydrolase [Dehalococcoidia bacterium]
GPGRLARTPTPLPTLEGTTGLFAATPGPTVISSACLEGASSTPTPTPTPDLRATPRGLPPTPAPFEPDPLAEDAALKRRLLDALGSHADDYAFFVKDLSTGAGAAHNADRLFNAASIFKLFVMLEVFNQQAAGLFDWQDRLTLTPYYDSFGLSPRSTSRCQVLTIAEAMKAMMSVSDNAAAVLLQDLVRSPNVNRTLQALGLKDSGLYPEGLPVTAADLGLLLEAIARGAAVSEAASAEMIELMKGEVIDNGLRAGLPPDVPVAHKTGNWSDATHDAGIVFAKNGPYVFVVLSETDHETSVIRALSAAAYEYFASR